MEPDETLVRDHLTGSEHAFARLVERHAAGLTAAIERLVEDHHLALDLAQEVFVKVHELLPGYRYQGRFRAWLYSIGLNRARDALRQQKRSRLVFLEESDVRARRELTFDPAPARECRQRVEAALDQVPPPFREAVVLRDLAGLTYAELAEALGCEVGTAKSRVNRGRMAFRDQYRGLMDEADTRPGGENHAF